MSKRYNWLKLSSDILNEPAFMIIKNSISGFSDLYLYIMIMLRSVNTDGTIRFTGVMDIYSEISCIFGIGKKAAERAWTRFLQYKLIEPLEENTYLVVHAVNAIGSESESAERVRNYRERKKNAAADSVSESKKAQSAVHTPTTHTAAEEIKNSPISLCGIDSHSESCRAAGLVSSQNDMDCHKSRASADTAMTAPLTNTARVESSADSAAIQKLLGLSGGNDPSREPNNVITTAHYHNENSAAHTADTETNTTARVESSTNLNSSLQSPSASSGKGGSCLAGRDLTAASEAGEAVHKTGGAASALGYSESCRRASGEVDRKEKKTPPTRDEVIEYAREMGFSHVDCGRFFNNYQAKGWRVNNQPIYDWRVLLEQWEVDDKSKAVGEASEPYGYGTQITSGNPPKGFITGNAQSKNRARYGDFDPETALMEAIRRSIEELDNLIGDEDTE